jgi:hypothetical protein
MLGKNYVPNVFHNLHIILLFLKNTNFISDSAIEFINNLINSKLTYWMMFFITFLSIITAFEYFFQRKGKKSINI